MPNFETVVLRSPYVRRDQPYIKSDQLFRLPIESVSIGDAKPVVRMKARDQEATAEDAIGMAGPQARVGA